jgi:hypothetical protein
MESLVVIGFGVSTGLGTSKVVVLWFSMGFGALKVVGVQFLTGFRVSKFGGVWVACCWFWGFDGFCGVESGSFDGFCMLTWHDCGWRRRRGVICVDFTAINLHEAVSWQANR